VVVSENDKRILDNNGDLSDFEQQTEEQKDNEKDSNEDS